MAYPVGGVSFDLDVNLKGFEKQLDKAFDIAKKKGAGLVWDTSSFVAGLKMTKKEFKSFSNEVDKAKTKYEEILDLQKNLQSSDLWSQIGDEARSAVEKAVSAAKEEAQIYDRTLKHMGRGQKIKGVFDGLKRVFSGLFSSFRQNTAKAGSEFSAFLKRLIGIGGVAILLRKAFSYAREGMQNLMKADATTANSVNTLRNALTALKNALAAAFAPILNTIAPILTKFIGMLTAAANAVASFISALTGKKFAVVASGVSDGLDGIGGSASGANDSAKELQRTLMGFDKINKLDSNSGGGSGGGGGGGGAGGGGGFDIVPVGDEANKWAEQFKKSWENADFYWLGELLANKINGALAKIPWDKINTGLKKIAKSIGTFLNGFIENLDWGLLGKTIGEGIKAALNFLNTFLETVNWKAVGQAIVEFLAGIDWIGIFNASATLLVNIANALYEILKGACGTAKDKIAEWLKKNDILEALPDAKALTIKVSFFNDMPAWLKKIVEFALDNNPLMLSLNVTGYIADTVSDILGWFRGDHKDRQEMTLVARVVADIAEAFKKVWDWFTGGNSDDKDISINLKKGTWNSDASKAMSTFNSKTKTKTKTLKQSVKKGSWNKQAYTASKIKGGTVTRTLKISTSITKGAQAVIDAAKNAGILKKAKGGLFKGGKWSPIQRYASGGLPDGSQLFWAREKGPELVGTLGGHTAVMNNDQIVASVSSGVAKAMAGIRFKMSAPVLANTSSRSAQVQESKDSDNREMVILLTQILKAINSQEFNVNLDGEQIKNNVVKRINNHTRATGKLEIVM